MACFAIEVIKSDIRADFPFFIKCKGSLAGMVLRIENALSGEDCEQMKDEAIAYFNAKVCS